MRNVSSAVRDVRLKESVDSDVLEDVIVIEDIDCYRTDKGSFRSEL